MAESSWPGAAPATVTEAQFEQWAEYTWLSGLVGTPLDQPPLFGDGTGMQVKVRAGVQARVRGRSWAAGDTDIPVPINGNTGNATRVDLVVLRLDRDTWNVRLEVVEGSPGGGVPTIEAEVGGTGQWDLPLGRVDVPAGEETTITAGMVKPSTRYLGPGLELSNGGQPGLNGQGEHPFGLRYMPAQDRLVLRRPAGTVDLWRDSEWVTLSAGNTGWQVTQPSYIRRVGPIVTLVLGNFLRTGGALSAGADSRLLASTIPVDMRYTGPEGVDVVAVRGNNDPVRISIYRHGSSTGRGGQVWLTNHGGFPSGSTLYGATVTWSV